MSEVVDVYTDGACKGNPGPGGWGVLLRWNAHEKELFGGEPNTTNNRMELRAVIEALADSKYVLDGITTWIHNWKKRGWKTAGKKPVKNVDLWQQLDALARQYTITWVWVKGHSGHDGNERADELANRGVVAA